MPVQTRSRRGAGIAAAAVTSLATLLIPYGGSTPSVNALGAPAPAAAGVGMPALAYVANDGGGGVEIRDYLGGSTISRPSAYNQGDDIAAGDVDGDGVDEVVVANDLGTNDGTGAVDVIHADGTVHEFVIQKFDGGDDEVAVGQLVKGGPAEIAVASTDQGTVRVYDKEGEQLEQVDTGFGVVDAFDVADVTADGLDEVLIANADGDSNGRVDVLNLEGQPMHPPVDTSYDDDDGDDAFAAGDVTGDGRADLVVANTEEGGRIDVHELHGPDDDTAFDLPSAYDNPNEVGAESTDALAVGDVTGDDVEDILVANTEGGRVDVHDLAGEDDGDFPSAYDDDDSFTASQARPSDLDTDGIPDQVEIDGIVSQHGTSPCRKDVLVESDVMVDTSGDADDHSHRPAQAAIDDVVDAFAAVAVPGVANCPYPGEDSTDGINLVVTEPAVSMETLGHDGVLDLPEEFDELKAQHFDELAADRYFHYAIWGHRFQDENGVKSGGRADAGSDDQDFVMALDDPAAQGSVPVQASTFMHEIGHTIGLRHGGDENLNCKPNYLSVMNYSMPFGPVDASGNAQLEFSATALPEINEKELDETVGIGSPANRLTTYTDKLGNLREGLPAAGAIDWSGDNHDGQGGTVDDKLVPADVNAKVRTVSGIVDCNELDSGEPILTKLHGFSDRDELAEDLEAIDFDGLEVPAPELTAADLASYQGELEATNFPDTTTLLDARRPGFHAASHGVAADERFVYATHGYRTVQQPATSDRAGSLVVVDRATMQVVARIRVGFGPSAVALDPGRDRAYVVNQGKEDYSLSVIDTKARVQIDEIDLHQVPVDVAVNTKLNRIYVANPFQKTIQVIDGATRTKLDPIPVGPGLSSLTVDENTGTVWYTAYVRGVPGAFASLGTVVDDGVNRPQVLPPLDLGSPDVRPVDVAIDPLLARVYVGGIGVGAPGEPPSVTVVHRNTRQQLARINTTGPIRAVAVDPDAGLIFASGDRGVDVLATGLTQVTRHIDAALPFSVAVGPGLTRQLYVGDFQTGELRRRNYGGGAPQ